MIKYLNDNDNLKMIRISCMISDKKYNIYFSYDTQKYIYMCFYNFVRVRV